jgi:ketosteroid isomerase-like protein
MKPKLIAAAAALISALALLPLTNAGPAQATDDVRSEASRLVAEAAGLQQLFVELFNRKDFDRLGVAYYVHDAIAVPPNHEPIHGRDAIIEYLRGMRDSLGELAVAAPLRGSASGDFVSMVGQYSALGDRVRATSHELYERQPDGSLRCTVDMFGFRDPLHP